MNRYLAGYLTMLLVMVALDMLWLGVIAKSAYQSGIAHLMSAEPNWVAALLFYLLYALGLSIFVLAPQADAAAWRPTVLMGALFGFFAYATYDLSNLATLREWPVSLTLMDLAWGTALSAACAAAGRTAMRLTQAG
ncbi:DUF2177 family protein [Kinneretia aquatilis]|uniref:DUF2177 family protein n=1 Tax=Kinneretia aquatilis TaxID=2070761 RepID=UPI0014950B3D|nr:DUF2177 family protein [Paucibacter aquatile]WIV97266.1 DUF2177 family protein [Paucibacter aquatile]